MLREDFLCFVPVEDTTGKGLAGVLLEKLKELNINLTYLRGQGYDGARSMSGQFHGCAAVIQKQYPEAVYVHCGNHSLNLAIANACKIPAVRNCISLIKETVNLFRSSSKAGKVLKDLIMQSEPNSKQVRLLKFCETRWVEHLDSLSLFFDVFQCICAALEQLDNEHLRSDVSKPHALLAAIHTPQFIVSIAVLKPIFALSKNLSILLQQKNCDLSSCVAFSNNLFAEQMVKVNEMRENAEQTFRRIFESVQQIAKDVDIDIKILRLANNQTNRDNYEGGPEDYYRRSIYIPFLDHFLEELKNSFVKHGKLLSKIENILPKKCVTLNDAHIEETVRVLASQWPNDLEMAEEFVAELKMWKRRNLNQTDPPGTFIDCLNVCDVRMFPYTNRLLKIGATLPVSVASSDRSFSSLRRLKTYLRSKTGAERLNGLGLLNIQRDVNINIDDILNIMAQCSRKMDIVL